MRAERVALALDAHALLAMALGSDAKMLALELQDCSPVTIMVPVAIRRRGQELRLVYQPPGEKPTGEVDPTLVGLIARAHRAREKLLDSHADLSEMERPHLTRLARLSYLAPDVQAAIVDGKQPVELTARQLLRAASLPSCWKTQRKVLGMSVRVSGC